MLVNGSNCVYPLEYAHSYNCLLVTVNINLCALCFSSYFNPIHIYTIIVHVCMSSSLSALYSPNYILASGLKTRSSRKKASATPCSFTGSGSVLPGQAGSWGGMIPLTTLKISWASCSWPINTSPLYLTTLPQRTIPQRIFYGHFSHSTTVCL